MRQLKAVINIIDGGSREGREDREGFEAGLSDRIAKSSERGVPSASYVHSVKTGSAECFFPEKSNLRLG